MCNVQLVAYDACTLTPPYCTHISMHTPFTPSPSSSLEPAAPPTPSSVTGAAPSVIHSSPWHVADSTANSLNYQHSIPCKYAREPTFTSLYTPPYATNCTTHTFTPLSYHPLAIQHDLLQSHCECAVNSPQLPPSQPSELSPPIFFITFVTLIDSLTSPLSRQPTCTSLLSPKPRRSNATTVAIFTPLQRFSLSLSISPL